MVWYVKLASTSQWLWQRAKTLPAKTCCQARPRHRNRVGNPTDLCGHLLCCYSLARSLCPRHDPIPVCRPPFHLPHRSRELLVIRVSHRRSAGTETYCLVGTVGPWVMKTFIFPFHFSSTIPALCVSLSLSLFFGLDLCRAEAGNTAPLRHFRTPIDISSHRAHRRTINFAAIHYLVRDMLATLFSIPPARRDISLFLVRSFIRGCNCSPR